MIQCHLEQKPAITIMCTSSEGPQASLSVSEWSILKELVQILQPLEEATRETERVLQQSDSFVECHTELLIELCKHF